MNYQSREEIPIQYKWDLAAIFKTEAQFDTTLQEINELIAQAASYKDTLAQSAEQLYQAFEVYYKTYHLVSVAYTYAHLNNDADKTNSHYTQMIGKMQSVYNDFMTAWSFFTPELLLIDDSKIQQFLQEYAPLQAYRFELEKLNQSRLHTLSIEEERILSLVQNPLGSIKTIFQQLDNADLKFDDVENSDGEHLPLTHGTYGTYLHKQDRTLRQSAFKSMYRQFKAHENTMAAILTAHLKSLAFNAKVRKYQSTREAALTNNYISEIVYDNLVNTINNNLHVLHRYVALRKRLLNVDELHMYDIYAPLTADMDTSITFDEAIDVCKKALAPLGEEYVSLVERSITERWIDVYETPGKRSGGYSSGTKGTHPYILLNWQNDWSSMYTLIHELGHSIHSYYTFNNQPEQYANYSIFVAEVASTCNEALLSEYLFNLYEGDKTKQIAILNTQLDRLVATLFRQTMFAEFEHLINEEITNNDVLTASRLNDMYYDLVQKYQGDAIKVDREIESEWARIPHFYFNYYVYQYATGISAAEALSAQILEQGLPVAQRYINKFLKAGSSDYPIEVLKAAGVDMTQAAPIEKAIETMSKLLDRYEALID